MAIAVVWAAWHLPLYAIEGTFQHDDVGFATGLFWLFTAALLPQTILMIWVVEHSGYSLLPAVVFHALTNISGEVLALSAGHQVGRLAIWSAVALGVVISWRCSPGVARRRAPRPARPGAIGKGRPAPANVGPPSRPASR